MTHLTFRPGRAFVRRYAITLLLPAALLTISCSEDDDGEPAVPDLVTINVPNLYPENLQYDAAGKRFLISSVTLGDIGQVTDDGRYSVFASATNAEGTRYITSTTGVYLDAGRNRVLVTAANLAAGGVARLLSFNRDNGQLLSDVDLVPARPAGNHFASDVALDAQGNAYVTDSFAPVLYKVDPQGVVTVLLDDPALGAPAGSFGINGIVFHPDGYLLVSKTSDGALFKVPLSNPAGFTRVTGTNVNLQGSDNLLLQDNNTLQTACNTQNRVYRVTSNDNWTTMSVTGTFEAAGQFPAAVARRGTDSYALYSRLDQLGQNPPVSAYGIAKVTY